MVTAAEAILSGQVSDDGIPGPITGNWQLVSGPGTVDFQSNTNSLVCAVTFSTNGIYTFRLTGSDGQFNATDDVVVTVGGNRPPTADAGEDQIVGLTVASGGGGTASPPLPIPDTMQLPIGQPGVNSTIGFMHSLAASGRK